MQFHYYMFYDSALLKNSEDPDQLVSVEAIQSVSTLFSR